MWLLFFISIYLWEAVSFSLYTLYDLIPIAMSCKSPERESYKQPRFFLSFNLSICFLDRKHYMQCKFVLKNRINTVCLRRNCSVNVLSFEPFLKLCVSKYYYHAMTFIKQCVSKYYYHAMTFIKQCVSKHYYHAMTFTKAIHWTLNTTLLEIILYFSYITRPIPPI